MTFRGSQRYNNYLRGKQKVDNDEQCYNCNRLGYYVKVCNQLDWRETRESLDFCTPNKLFSHTPQNNNNALPARRPKKIHQVVAEDDSDFSEPFIPEQVAKAMMVAESLLPKMEKTCEMWYLDSCAFQHLCNDKSLFKNLQPMCIDFVTAAS